MKHEYKGHNKSSLTYAKEIIFPKNDESSTRMLPKFKKENEAELHLANEQLSRERDIEIKKMIVKISEDQTSWKKVFEIKSAGNEEAIKIKYLDELEESKRLEQDLREH